MNTEELNKRTHTLANACIKVSVLLPTSSQLGILIKEKVLLSATDLAVSTRGLGYSQNSEYFLKRLNAAADASNACSFWLEMVRDERLMDSSLIVPLIEECDALMAMFLLASKKVKDKLE